MSAIDRTLLVIMQSKFSPSLRKYDKMALKKICYDIFQLTFFHEKNNNAIQTFYFSHLSNI
jgi:hypothetical protein